MKSFVFSLVCSCLLLDAAPVPSYTLIEDRSHLEILTPSIEKRQTAKLRLQNGLEAYLISDPNLPQSAAALTVEVGSWDDPKEYPGMAHLLEHMLFLGTAAYPDEAEYMQYIKENGGTVNAYTASDRTMYAFSVNNSRFEGALNRFSHFFISPLFLSSCIERELHAVDQEHAKNIENDGWRQYMIFKETANRHHPCTKFSTGNAETLGGIPQEKMKQWYQQHYNARKMHLVVYSNLPINELIELTVRDFSSVPTSPQDPKQPLGNMTSDKQKGAMIYVKPIKKIKTLSMMWELPETLAQENDSKAGYLLGYILENRGKNSLLAILKKERLAESIQVSEERFSKTHKLFNLDVELTDFGVKSVKQVINHCFEALKRLKKEGIPRYIFDEAQTIADLKYRYQSRDDAFAFALQTADEMIHEEIETFPRKTRIPTQYCPEVYNQYLNHLTPQNTIFFVTAEPQLTGVATDQHEKWMRAEYAVRKIDPKDLQMWASIPLNPHVNLPPPNPYIPRYVDLVHYHYKGGPVIPQLIAQTANAKAYYSDDTQYLVPEIAYLFRIQSPLINGSAKSRALVDLYCKSLCNALDSTIQAADSAGSKVSIAQGNFSLDIGINGYSEPSFRLTKKIFESTKKNITTYINFNRFKTYLLSQYANHSKELPVAQALETFQNVLFNNRPTSEEKYCALEKVNYEEFCHFANNLLQKAYLQSLFYGNLTAEEAKRLHTSLIETLEAEPFIQENHYSREILLLPSRQGPFMISAQTPMQGNSTVLAIQEGPYSFEKRASQQVLGKVLTNEFFETLRTKQQTAYIAKAWEMEAEKQLLQLFAVQSSTHQPSDLISRFELFLENFIKNYTSILPAKRFENVRQMAITSLQMPPENLSSSAQRLFSLGFDYDGDFYLTEKRIQALEALTYDATHKDAIRFLSRLNTRRLAILFEGAPHKRQEFRYELTSKQELKTNGTFVTKGDKGILNDRHSPAEETNTPL